MEKKKGFEVLWAPWRMEYVTAHKAGGCFLCALDREEPSEENLLLARTSRALVVFNRYPYNNGHLLIAPRHHTSDLAALDAPSYAHLMELFRFSLGVLRRAMGPE